MDPSVAAILSTLISAISTAILMYSAYHWPAGHNRADDNQQQRRRRRARDQDKE